LLEESAKRVASDKGIGFLVNTTGRMETEFILMGYFQESSVS
jgi:hypothetical protein